ncbi:ABC transporter-related protein [Chloroherpeton thalassium ATCC 35110]|uniref:ABC transporter-related protein n=1 Tax=Chloroherpeton thalassium (strain ATCC 35110 / GB-78) TaxID=517418 RepID=B3QT60_CHLT3|nr:ABC transporter ATP-binding protein [Chloroherpeton thalassium]ACF14159.1 ABC transporter-related protein [Chloroherpeton thalassium ATCC 35110]
MKSLLSLNKYLYKFRKYFFFGFFWIICTNVFLIISPKFIGAAIDEMKSDFDFSSITKHAILAILSSAASGFFLFKVRRSIIVASRLIEYDLKNDFYAHIQTLSLSFFKQTSTGDLMARATNDMNSVRNYFGPAIMYSINTVFRLVFTLSAMIAISPMLTLYALLPAPILSYSVYRIGQAVHKRTKVLQKRYADITSKVQENLSGIRVIKAYTREENEAEQFGVLNQKYYEQNLSLAKVQALFQTFTSGLLGISLIVMIWVGGGKVIHHEITIGEIAQFVIYLGVLTWPLISIGWVTNMVQRAAAAQKRINAIFEIAPEITDTPSCDRSISSLHGSIEFKHVSVAYPANPENPVLKQVSFSVPQGSKLAIIGATGSGKSSLVNLIPRFFDPTEGEILIDGISLKNIPLSVLRQHIGFVTQDHFLFSETIGKNIALGLQQNSLAEVETAAKQAAIYDDVMSFPAQFETMLGERGITLSGGQKQRTCIARALIRKPKILILDDALSAVDTNTESLILKQLDTATDGMTAIIISHRTSTVKNCDKILVLSEGEIAELGSHEELIEKDGLYAELYRKQLLEEELSSMD